MYRILKLLLLLFIFPISLSSQPQEDLKRDRVWPFSGSDSGNSPNELLGVDLNFNGDTLEIIQDVFQARAIFAMSSICNDEGNLLFFSNGCSVFGPDNELLINGDSLNSGYWRDSHCPEGIIMNQGILILPITDKKYWLIYQRLDLESSGGRNTISYDRVYYTVIEEGINGKPLVVLRDQILVDNAFLLGGNIATCRHANGRDWWLIMSEGNSNRKYKVLIDVHGNIQKSMQNIGNDFVHSESLSGNSKISPDGAKLAIYNVRTDLHTFDFNRCTGELSNYQNIKITDEADRVNAAGLAFSPNSRFVYLPSTQHIYQFDLWAQDLKSSKTIIAEYDGRVNQSGLAARFYQAQQGPDGKIYIGSPGNRGSWHVIDNPNAFDISSQIIQHRHYITNNVNTGAMPHFPNFRLGPAKGTICDSLDILSWLSIESQPYNQTVCNGSEAHFEVTAFGFPLEYQWQVMKDTSWLDITNDFIYSGAEEHLLKISSVSLDMNDWQYRCIVTDEDEVKNSNPATLFIKETESVIADFDYTINEDTIFFQNNSQNLTFTKAYFGDGASLDSITNQGYYVYKPPYY